MGCLLDSCAGTIVFDQKCVYFSCDPLHAMRTRIAVRSQSGLYIVDAGTIPPPDAPTDAAVHLTVAGQVRREQVH